LSWIFPLNAPPALLIAFPLSNLISDNFAGLPLYKVQHATAAVPTTARAASANFSFFFSSYLISDAVKGFVSCAFFDTFSK